MQEYFEIVFAGISINDLIDIIIVSFIAYKILDFVKETRAQQLLKGIAILLIAFVLSDLLALNTVNWLLESLSTIGVIALVVIFQPELRRALEYIGKSKIVSISKMSESDAAPIIDELVKSVLYMAQEKQGALIVIEKETSLNEIAETGTRINADINSELIKNIFYDGAPLHDGAIIIRGNKIISCGCVLPLTTQGISKELGTRHRAGIGISEHSDALALIVSEETGVISIAENGRIMRNLKEKGLRNKLNSLYTKEDSKKCNYD